MRRSLRLSFDGLGRALLVAVVVLCAASPTRAATPTADAQSVRQKLDQLRAGLDAQRVHLRELSQKERNIVVTLSELDASIAELDRGLGLADVNLEALTASKVTLETQTATQAERVADLKRRLSLRLRRAYTDGEGSGVRHILGASSFTEYAYRRRYIQTRAEGDALLVQQLSETVSTLDAQRKALVEAESEAKTLTDVLAQSRALLAETKTARRAAIDDIESQKDLAMRYVEENVKAQQQTQSELAAILKNAPRRTKRRGSLKLSRPVSGPIIRYFGTVRDKVTRAKVTSNGIDIRAALGTPVKAPAGGTVVYQGVMRGFGLLVILDVGDKTHVLMGNLSRTQVNRGDVVEQGHVLGFVGDTGSTNGAKLYFEVRRRSRPVNPVRYLPK